MTGFLVAGGLARDAGSGDGGSLPSIPAPGQGLLQAQQRGGAFTEDVKKARGPEERHPENAGDGRKASGC